MPAVTEVYAVGGSVRDELLGLPVKDQDFVIVGATPEQLIAAGYKPVGRDFPVFLHPQTHAEYALARTERKQGRGHQGFTFYTGTEVTLEQDLQRRDLTINAIARDAEGHLIDPYAGIQDLEARILRHVSPAFAEDPLRVLRVARFAARLAPLGFRVADETLELMRVIVSSGELGSLSAERIWQEMHKALVSPAPQVFIQTLRDCQALAEILTEIDALFGVPQPAEHHPEVDTGQHILLCLEQAAQFEYEPVVTYAVLLHDLGKGLTPEAELPHHFGHEKAGVKLVRQIGRRLKVPRKYTELAELASQWHLHVHRSAELKAATLLKMFEQTDALRRPERFQQFLQVCEMDARGRAGLQQRDYPQAQFCLEALNVLLAMDIQAIVAVGESGDVGRRIHNHRLSELKQFVKARSAAAAL